MKQESAQGKPFLLQQNKHAYGKGSRKVPKKTQRTGYSILNQQCAPSIKWKWTVLNTTRYLSEVCLQTIISLNLNYTYEAKSYVNWAVKQSIFSRFALWISAISESQGDEQIHKYWGVSCLQLSSPVNKSTIHTEANYIGVFNLGCCCMCCLLWKHCLKAVTHYLSGLCDTWALFSIAPTVFIKSSSHPLPPTHHRWDTMLCRTYSSFSPQ